MRAGEQRNNFSIPGNPPRPGAKTPRTPSSQKKCGRARVQTAGKPAINGNVRRAPFEAREKGHRHEKASAALKNALGRSALSVTDLDPRSPACKTAAEHGLA